MALARMKDDHVAVGGVVLAAAPPPPAEIFGES